MLALENPKHPCVIALARFAAIGVGDIGLRYHFRRQVAARFLYFQLFASSYLHVVFLFLSAHFPHSTIQLASCTSPSHVLLVVWRELVS